MKEGNKILILVGIFIALCILFMFFDAKTNLDYVLPRRGLRLSIMIIVAISVGYSSILFQTITNNKILTPAIMGYEDIFILFQTVIVYLYGDKTFKVLNNEENFIFAVLLMMLLSVVMYFLIFSKSKRNIYHLLLLGIVLGVLFQKAGQFLQIIIDPDEFSVVQSFMFVSFNKMNINLFYISAGTLLVTLLFAQRYVRYLDVIALGREHSINLGLNYNNLIRIYMLVISLLVSVSTALVGPVTFLGILVTNLTYELFATRKHKYMLSLCAVVSCITVISGQFLIEHVFEFSTTVSIVINFVGGIYFLYLILKARKKL